METAIGFGKLTDGTLTLPSSKLEKFNQPEWKARRWPWVDPLKDVQANVTAVQNRFKSHRQIISEQGGDVEDTLQEIAEDEALAESKGVELDATPQAKVASESASEPEETLTEQDK
jgi:capsid protein